MMYNYHLYFTHEELKPCRWSNWPESPETASQATRIWHQIWPTIVQGLHCEPSLTFTKKTPPLPAKWGQYQNYYWDCNDFFAFFHQNVTKIAHISSSRFGYHLLTTNHVEMVPGVPICIITCYGNILPIRTSLSYVRSKAPREGQNP